MDDERLSRPDRLRFPDRSAARRFQARLAEVRPAPRETPPTILYDESGYPVEDRGLGLTGRLRRLITG